MDRVLLLYLYRKPKLGKISWLPGAGDICRIWSSDSPFKIKKTEKTQNSKILILIHQGGVSIVPTVYPTTSTN